MRRGGGIPAVAARAGNHGLNDAPSSALLATTTTRQTRNQQSLTRVLSFSVSGRQKGAASSSAITMPVVLYNLVGSPPCGFIRCLAKHIGVELNLNNLDFTKGEHRTEQFLKVNPFHKVPAIDDDGFIVYESNAIAYYLLRKYSPESELYPACIETRTRIDQVLAAASSNIHPQLGAFFRPRYFQSTKPSAEEVKAFEENVVKNLENLIGDSKFAVGDKLTAADLCLIGHVTVCLEFPCVDKAKYPKLTAYYELVKNTLPYYQEIFGPFTVQAKQLWDRLK
ncbi:glutathione S-transferase 1-1-like [Dermacentor andersoni]|uniref:glutathione S-transferase 1-1-like n=1 Tax=Dermacentor andersoni TaxID=34620 RepID=UPI003B3A5D9A